RIADEIVAVHLRSAQGKEHAAGLHLARVGVERGERLADLRAADLTAAGHLEDLEETEPHTYMRTGISGLVLCAIRRRCAERSPSRSARRSGNRRSASSCGLSPGSAVCAPRPAS